MYLGYLTNCVALKKMGGYAYLKLTNSKIQIRFWVKKKIKAGKVAKKKLKKPKKSKRKVINENKGSGITFELVKHNN